MSAPGASPSPDATLADVLAARLLAVRAGAPLLDPPPRELAPANLEAAYAVADRIVRALEPRLGPVRGYKVGATSEPGQRMLGLPEPFYGRDFARTVLDDAAEWPCSARAFTAEAEIGFVIARDLPPRAEPYAEHEVGAAIARAVPLFEINAPAYAKPFEVGGLWLVADNGVTQGLIVGAPGRVLDGGPPIREETVRVLRDGAPCAEGVATAALGDPLRAVHWLANALSRRSKGLRAGDVVASGALTPPLPIAPGDVLEAEYATLGRVRLHGVPGVMGKADE